MPPQSPNQLTTGDVKISESEANENKYLLLKVPHFATDPAGEPAPQSGGPLPNQGRNGETMTSYLRLGAAATEPEAGDDLIPHAFNAGPAGMPGFEGTAGDGEWPPNLDKDSPFLDDYRNRGAGNVEPTGAPGHGMTQEQRKKWHTKQLLTRGGWRDHSDGNRITTTYGDKVEVIRGNYKMVVMGRQDDPGNAMGWDATGNHIQDYAQATMPGASVTVEWIQNAYAEHHDLGDGESYDGGAWLLINSTERVYQYSRNAGNFREQVWGDKNETYVGSENPERVGTSDGAGYQGHPSDGATHTTALDAAEFQRRIRPSSKGLPRGNPHIIEKTWASKIESYTGSAAWRIPEIKEETYAQEVSSLTDVLGSVTDTTTIAGAQTSTTTVAGAVTETTTLLGTQTSTTSVGGAVTETTTVAGAVTSTETVIGAKTELSILGVATSSTTAGALTENTNAGVATTIDIVGGKIDVAAVGGAIEVAATGLKLGVEAGISTFDFSLVGFKFAFELAAVIEIFIGYKLELNVSKGSSYCLDGEVVTVTKKDVGVTSKYVAADLAFN